MAILTLGHPPQNREQLWWTVRALFGVTIPRTRVCPDHCSPFDAFADAYFGQCTIRDGQPLDAPYKVSRAIWHASRGLAGKSKTLSILGLTLGYIDGADLTILGGSLSQSVNVHEYMTRAMDSPNLPRDMTLDLTATKILLSNRGRVRPLPASQKNVRGPHPSILLMDEVDEMELAIYDAALGQPLPQQSYLELTVPSLTIISSTWQNPDGTFTEILRRVAEEESEGYTPIYRWCYKESANAVDGWLSPATIEEKKATVTAEMFRTEYDLGEPAIGNRAFDPQCIERAFGLRFKPDSAIGTGPGYLKAEERKDSWLYVFEGYVKGATYVSGADWAKERDYTVIWVARIDGPTRRMVYFRRVNRRPYPVMIGYYNQALRTYKIPTSGAWHDSTGLGDVIDDYVDTRARAFAMTGDKRAKLLNNYVNAIEKGSWQLPRIPKLYTEHKFCSVGDLFSNTSGYHLPDTVAAGALAEYAATRVRSDAPPLVVKRDGSPSALGAQFSAAPDSEEDGVPEMAGEHKPQHPTESPDGSPRPFSLIV